MSRRLSVTVERFPLAREFRIARGAKTEAAVVTAMILDGEHTGRGECVPYARYGESLESVCQQIEDVREAIESGCSAEDLLQKLEPGAARNALDCALWDLQAKLTGQSVASLICDNEPQPLETAYTLSLDEPEVMAEAARVANRSLLKVKVGTTSDVARLRAIHAAAPHARLIVDANEGWTQDNIGEHMLAAAQAGAVLVEQPLPAGQDAILREIPHPVPVCADESAHTALQLGELLGLYDYVNVKLDKTGGLTEAVRMVREAHGMGFGVMIGCMVGTSLAMAPAVLLAQTAQFVDLDGPLLLAKDREGGLRYSATMVSPPDTALWG